ncbi:MAG: hypothetical protein GY735_10440 [Delftia sp.]|nr:hypothetical protein [Delftia sp.]
MKKDIYKPKRLSIENTCSSCSIDDFNEYMKGAKKANGSKIRRLIKKHLPGLYNQLCLDFKNPYESQSQKTKTHFIYVHSAIEYFIKIEY